MLVGHVDDLILGNPAILSLPVSN